MALNQKMAIILHLLLLLQMDMRLKKIHIKISKTEEINFMIFDLVILINRKRMEMHPPQMGRKKRKKEENHHHPITTITITTMMKLQILRI